MKKIKFYFATIIILVIAGSCEIDNYDGPNAAFYGTIIDNVTQGPIEQDIINGAQIEYIEQGFANPKSQYLIIKTDGTFRNNQMFAGTYSIRPVKTNFVPVGSQEIEINGETKLDFLVQPYIRVNDVTIQKSGTKIVATFKIQQTVTDDVIKIGLYAHPEPSVGEPMNTVKTEQDINAVTDENTVYTLEIDLTSSSSVLKPGKQYFFRVGALIDAPESMFNYDTAVRIAI